MNHADARTFRDLVQRQDVYGICAFARTLGDPRDLPLPAFETILMALASLGRHDETLRLCLDNPHVAEMKREHRGLILWNAVATGNGALMADGRLPMSATTDELNVLTALAACLVQAGESAKAEEVFQAMPSEALGFDMVARHGINARIKASGAGTWDEVVETAKSVGAKKSEAWHRFECQRYVPFEEPIHAVPEPTADAIDRTAQHHNSGLGGPDVCAVTAHQTAPFAPAPDMAPDRLASRLSKVLETVAELRNDSWIAAQQQRLHDLRRRYAPAASGPVQVVSTGRAGTTALFRFVDRAPFMPFHTMGWTTTPRDRWGVVARLLSDDLSADSLYPLVRLFLSARIAEIAAAYRVGRTPVLINHWDVIFAPVVAGLFEDSRFLRLTRRPAPVIHSMIAKRQFGGIQLASLPHRREPGGGFLFDCAALDDVPEKVAWYLAFTDRWWEALQATLPERCLPTLDSESMFAGEAKAVTILREAFPGLGVERSEVAAHFSDKINEKPDHKVADDGTVDRMIQEAGSRLERYGTAPSPVT